MTQPDFDRLNKVRSRIFHMAMETMYLRYRKRDLPDSMVERFVEDVEKLGFSNQYAGQVVWYMFRPSPLLCCVRKTRAKQPVSRLTKPAYAVIHALHEAEGPVPLIQFAEKDGMLSENVHDLLRILLDEDYLDGSLPAVQALCSPRAALNPEESGTIWLGLSEKGRG